MTRDLFLRVATRVLRQTAGYPPEQQAEAIAVKMDEVAELLGDNPAPAQVAPGAPQPPARMAFPSPNPEALAPADDTTGFACTGLETDSYVPSGVALPGHQGPPLIIPATTIPDRDQIERVQPAANPEPVRSLRPAGKLKVEELSRLIQERTPARVTVEVPMEDGTTHRATFARDVLSMHAFDSVRILLYPPGATGTARESVQVQCDVHIEDGPFDFRAIMQNLAEQAIQAVRPRGAPRELPVKPFSGPVMHSADEARSTPQCQDLATRTETIFRSIG